MMIGNQAARSDKVKLLRLMIGIVPCFASSKPSDKPSHEALWTGSPRVKIASALTFLAVTCAATMLAGCSPSDRALRGSLSDAHLQLIGGADALRAPFGDSAKLHLMMIAEDRELDWAGETERRIAQFIELDDAGDQFDLSGVECRQSICEIQVVSEEVSALPTWDRVVDDITRQPWNDFNQTSTSSNGLSGQLIVITHLLRKDSKYRHCFVNPDEGACPEPWH